MLDKFQLYNAKRVSIPVAKGIKFQKKSDNEIVEYVEEVSEF